MAAPTQPAEREILTVTQALQRANSALDAYVGDLWVEGEVFEFTGPHSSGHYYFRLRDRDATLSVIVWGAQAARALRCRLEEGRSVLGHGRFDIYPKGGRLSFLLDHVEDRGAGDLARRFELLKQRLLAEGLFAPERKKPVPARPRSVVLITAHPSAAAADVLRTLEELAAPVRVWLRRTRVQGPEAPDDLLAALREAERARPDLVLLTRGGGSLEDLWAFNEERVVRALAACSVPTLCGVGHETDFTLCDFAADERAKTPTAAAHRIGQGWSAAREEAAALAAALQAAARARLAAVRGRLDRLGRNLRGQRPDLRVTRQRHAVYEAQARLHDAMAARLRGSRERLRRAARDLAAATPARRVELLHVQAQGLSARLRAGAPEALLRRGYALVEVPGRPGFLRRAADVRPGERVHVRLAEGRLDARVEDVHPGSEPR